MVDRAPGRRSSGSTRSARVRSRYVIEAPNPASSQRSNAGACSGVAGPTAPAYAPSPTAPPLTARVGDEEMREDEIGLDLDAVVGMDEVGQRVGIADDELNVEKPRRAGTPPRFVDQIGIAVDADDAPGERRKSQGHASGPGADVD